MRAAVFFAGLAVSVTGCVAASSAATVTLPPAKRACVTVDLHPTLFLQGATGKLLGGVRFRVTAKTPCSIQPVPPTVRLFGSRARVQYGVMPPQTRPERRTLRSLHAGEHVSFDLSWSNWCARAPTVLRVRFAVGHADYWLRLPHGTPPCLSRAHPSVLRVSRFVPLD